MILIHQQISLNTFFLLDRNFRSRVCIIFSSFHNFANRPIKSHLEVDWDWCMMEDEDEILLFAPFESWMTRIRQSHIRSIN
jgi:hypothetical protein